MYDRELNYKTNYAVRCYLVNPCITEIIEHDCYHSLLQTRYHQDLNKYPLVFEILHQLYPQYPIL